MYNISFAWVFVSLKKSFIEVFLFIQTEVPLGLQRVSAAFGSTLDSDLSKSDLLSKRYSGKPAGFPTANELSRKYGSGHQSSTSSADVVMVRGDTIDIFEIKTRNQRIEGINDIHEAFGQLLMYLDRFTEDFPTLTREYTLRGAVLAEDSDIDIEMLKPSFSKRNLGYFDSVRGGFLLSMKSAKL